MAPRSAGPAELVARSPLPTSSPLLADRAPQERLPKAATPPATPAPNDASAVGASGGRPRAERRSALPVECSTKPNSFHPCLALRQYFQERGIRIQDDCRLIVQHLFVGLEGPHQLIKVRILGIRLPINARGRGVAFTANLFGVLVRGRKNLLFLAVGVGANHQRLLLAFRAVLHGDALA